MWDHAAFCSYVTGLFSWAECLLNLPILSQMARFPSFIRLNNKPLCVYSSFSHNCSELKTFQLSINLWMDMDKKKVVYSYSGIMLSNKKWKAWVKDCMMLYNSCIWSSREGKTTRTRERTCQGLSLVESGRKNWFQKDMREFGRVMEIYCILILIVVTWLYTRSVQKVSSHVMWKIETFIEEDTRNIVHRTMMPQFPLKQALWNLIQFSQSPSAAPLNLIKVLNLFPFKSDFSFGKGQKSQGAKSGL